MLFPKTGMSLPVNGKWEVEEGRVLEREVMASEDRAQVAKALKGQWENSAFLWLD